MRSPRTAALKTLGSTSDEVCDVLQSSSLGCSLQLRAFVFYEHQYWEYRWVQGELHYRRAQTTSLQRAGEKERRFFSLCLARGWVFVLAYDEHCTQNNDPLLVHHGGVTLPQNAPPLWLLSSVGGIILLCTLLLSLLYTGASALHLAGVPSLQQSILVDGVAVLLFLGYAWLTKRSRGGWRTCVPF